MPNKMKPWQHGMDIDELKKLEKFYAPYNRFSASPFSKVKKNDIAASLHDKTMFFYPDRDKPIAAYKMEVAKVRTPITMHGKTVIGYKEKGDTVLSCVYVSEDHHDISDMYAAMLDDHQIMKSQNIWLYAWADDCALNTEACKLHYTFIGSKITTFGEIINIYFRDAPNNLVPRTHPVVPKEEFVNIKMMGRFYSTYLQDAILGTIDTLNYNFENHYSNYNKNKSWSAISLRGYSLDPTFITKPSEMNDKWKEQHKNENFFLQDTPLRKHFGNVDQLLEHAFGKDVEFHRIRLMKLAPNQGELERHTDQVDKDAYNSVGGLGRFHFPIKTNDGVEFTSWNIANNPTTVNMKVGEMWFLDTRKPHRVINKGTEDRIHLVVDVVMTPYIVGRLNAS